MEDKGCSVACYVDSFDADRGLELFVIILYKFKSCF